MHELAIDKNKEYYENALKQVLAGLANDCRQHTQALVKV